MLRLLPPSPRLFFFIWRRLTPNPIIRLPLKALVGADADNIRFTFDTKVLCNLLFSSAPICCGIIYGISK